jgi:hypothetical protein
MGNVYRARDRRLWFNATRDAERSASIEQVGAKLRALMPYLKPVTTEETVGTR